MGRIGATEILILLILLGIIPFFLGYYIGRKSGYIKRIKEEEKR